METRSCGSIDCLETSETLESEVEAESVDAEFYRKIYVGLTVASLKHFLYSSLAGLVWSFSLFSILVGSITIWGFDSDMAPNYLALVPASLTWLIPKIVSLGFAETFITLMFLQFILLALGLWIYFIYRMVTYLRSAFYLAVVAKTNPMLPGLSGYLMLVSSLMVFIGLLTIYTAPGTMVYLAGNIVFMIGLSLYAFNLSDSLRLARVNTKIPFYILLAAPVAHMVNTAVGLLGFTGFAMQFIASLALLARLRKSLNRLYGSNGEDVIEAISKALNG
ncbi:hypothetical protein [Aeropyrum camini]|uniref:Uncharacterized protein n=1 Tax=Aeropyrum camini SY1 = JCM 12091 TaxID=1198449 RepID=U3TBX2_9CREN|nr:hypothetical protein [Aeropyrum camini]BAN91037.1 hypothetical protein ACAM_1568 [Aeropyrum camini SY1 = JCM 12091]